VRERNVLNLGPWGCLRKLFFFVLTDDSFGFVGEVNTIRMLRGSVRRQEREKDIRVQNRGWAPNSSRMGSSLYFA